jgi:septal ring factor EnvC (AmiA/AmiB activator)
MGALNIPSAADIERITRRLRSVSQRLEGIEDALDRLEAQTGSAAAAVQEAGGDKDVDQRLDEIARDLAALRKAVAPGEEPPPRSQERLTVSDS